MSTVSMAILADTSGSMSELAGSRRKIDALGEILRTLPRNGVCRSFAFDSVTREVDGNSLPEPSGGTDLARALSHIAPLRPKTVVVISDGLPDDQAAALAAARQLNCRITTYFCGNERDTSGIIFLRALAFCSDDGLGSAALTDLSRPQELAGELRLLLGGPTPR
jgi:hypothetical protein